MCLIMYLLYNVTYLQNTQQKRHCCFNKDLSHLIYYNFYHDSWCAVGHMIRQCCNCAVYGREVWTGVQMCNSLSKGSVKRTYFCYVCTHYLFSCKYMLCSNYMEVVFILTFSRIASASPSNNCGRSIHR